MGLYNVVGPCSVNGLHYVNPTTQPIQVDDDVAATLVEAGSLEPYPPGGIPGKTGTILEGIIRTFPEAREAMESIDEPFTEVGQHAGEEFVEGVAEPDSDDKPEPTSPRPRARRKSDPEDAA